MRSWVSNTDEAALSVLDKQVFLVGPLGRGGGIMMEEVVWVGRGGVGAVRLRTCAQWRVNLAAEAPTRRRWEKRRWTWPSDGAAERLVTLRGGGSGEPMPCDRIRRAVPGSPTYQIQSRALAQAATPRRQAQLPRREGGVQGALAGSAGTEALQFQLGSTTANAPKFPFSGFKFRPQSKQVVAVGGGRPAGGARGLLRGAPVSGTSSDLEDFW